MNNKVSIQIRAAMLVFVFGLNTVMGFACSVGIGLNFNSKHHQEEATEAEVHIHNEKKQGHKKPDSYTGNKKTQAGGQKKNCCTDQVKKFDDLDKSLPQFLIIVHPDFLKGFFDVHYNADLPANDIVRNIKQFVRSYHPPITDIRVALQSFQI